MYTNIACMSCACVQSWFGRTLYKLNKMYKYTYWLLTGALYCASDLKIIIYLMVSWKLSEWFEIAVLGCRPVLQVIIIN